MAKKTPEEILHARKAEKRRTLINKGRIVPNINYKYWLEVSKNRQDSPTNGTFSSMLTILRNNLSNTDVIWEVVNDENRATQTMNGILKKGHEYADEIYRELNEKDFTELKQKKTDVLYLGIFDIVQGWGGITGRIPYTKNSSYFKNQPRLANLSARNSPDKWLSVYKAAVSLIKNGEFMKALITFESINGLGISFASKHLWFWANYFKSKGLLKDRSVHVYDTRIARMLYGRKADTQDYNHVSELYDDIIKTYDLIDMSHSDIEQALFAFSNTFYDNNLKHFHSDYNEDPISKNTSQEDIMEAKRLFCIRNSSSCENGEPKEAFKDLRSVSDVYNEDEKITGIKRLPTNKSGIFSTVGNLKKGAKSKIYDKIKAWLNNPINDIEKIYPKGSIYNSLKFIRDEPEPSKTTEDLKKEKAEQKSKAKEESGAGKAMRMKEEAQNKIKVREKAESLRRFPTEVESIDENTLKLTGSDNVYYISDYKRCLEKEQMGYPISQELAEVRNILRTVDPNYLNSNWRDVQGYIF